MSLSSTLCAVLVLGPVMKETDLKANQNCRSLFQDMPREGVEIYSRCGFGFGGGFGLVWNSFFGLDVSIIGSLSTSWFAASTSSSSASSTNSSSVKIWHLLIGSVFKKMCVCAWRQLLKWTNLLLHHLQQQGGSSRGRGSGSGSGHFLLSYRDVARSCKRQKVNQCVSNPYICTCTCIYSKKTLQGTGQQTELVHNSQLQTEPNHWTHSDC